jgi:hypothetical protein
MQVVQSQLRYATGVLIVIAAGALGGLVAGIGALAEGGKTTDRREYLATRGVSTRFFLFARTVVGVGGATAVLLASLSVNKFTGASDIDLLALTALCFVAGSIGHRLLPLVAEQIERRLRAAETKADEAARQGQEASDQARLNSDIQAALEVLNSKEPMSGLVADLIQRLEDWSKTMPLNRRLFMTLDNLYAVKWNDPDHGIKTLRRFIANKGATRDNDVADALRTWLAITR